MQGAVHVTTSISTVWILHSHIHCQAGCRELTGGTSATVVAPCNTVTPPCLFFGDRTSISCLRLIRNPRPTKISIIAIINRVCARALSTPLPFLRGQLFCLLFFFFYRYLTEVVLLIDIVQQNPRPATSELHSSSCHV